MTHLNWLIRYSNQFLKRLLTLFNFRPSDDMFIASLAEKFQAFGDGAGPISCPQFEYPILVPPAQR